MTYTVTSQVIKPESVSFWKDSDPENFAKYANVISNSVGVISFTESDPTSTKITATIVCEDANSWDSLVVTLNQDSYAHLRNVYNSTNGITETWTAVTS